MILKHITSRIPDTFLIVSALLYKRFEEAQKRVSDLEKWTTDLDKQLDDEQCENATFRDENKELDDLRNENEELKEQIKQMTIEDDDLTETSYSI